MAQKVLISSSRIFFLFHLRMSSSWNQPLEMSLSPTLRNTIFIFLIKHQICKANKKKKFEAKFCAIIHGDKKSVLQLVQLSTFFGDEDNFEELSSVSGGRNF